jgi:hypothetical protein
MLTADIPLTEAELDALTRLVRERLVRLLLAEQQKLDRDRWLAPALAVAAVIGGLLGVASFIAKVIS